jgi:hypothetical protein
MKTRIAGILATVALILGVSATSAQAGGTAKDFYYGPKYGNTVLGFRGQATNYDSSNHSRQTYHWAFKSIPSGYRAFAVKICANQYLVSGKTEGYNEYANRTMDCPIEFRIVRLSTNVVITPSKISGSVWN